MNTNYRAYDDPTPFFLPSDYERVPPVAYYGFPDKIKSGDTWPVARGLATGDWCGELLWEVEQFMIDHGIEPRSNTTLNPDHYPLRGWWNGQKSIDVAREDYHKLSNEQRTFWAEEPK